MKTFNYSTDSEDYLTFWNGVLSVAEDGSSDREVELTPKAATDLASHLLQWATQNREPFDDKD